MRAVKVVVDPNPTYTTSDPTLIWIANEDHVSWPSLHRYLNRLLEAGVIEDWYTDPVEDPATPESVQRDLERRFSEALDISESGYEDRPGSGGEDMGYRSAMNDAGRGALLR